MSTRHAIVLQGVLRVLRPLVRLLLRHGVTYPSFAASLKQVFLDAAQDELARQGMARTDSALTLLSGVHRRDVRQLREAAAAPALARNAAAGSPADAAPLSMAGEVVAHWLSHRPWLAGNGRARRLPRSGEHSFDALVASVSQDVRPRAMLDELLRLGVVTEDEAGIALVADGFAPRQGFAEMAHLFAANLSDHAAAAAANLHHGGGFLEQAVYVDQISAASAAHLHQAARQAWQRSLKDVMREAQSRFDADAKSPRPEDRQQRARFGVYFYNEPDGT